MEIREGKPKEILYLTDFVNYDRDLREMFIKFLQSQKLVEGFTAYANFINANTESGSEKLPIYYMYPLIEAFLIKKLNMFISHDIDSFVLYKKLFTKTRIPEYIKEYKFNAEIIKSISATYSMMLTNSMPYFVQTVEEINLLKKAEAEAVNKLIT